MTVATQPGELQQDGVALQDRFNGSDHDAIVLLLVTAALLIPIWSFHYFPTTDGAAHIANADVLLHYHRADGAAYRQFYELNPQWVPNAMGHWMLAGLMLLLPPLMAEKVLISAYALLLPVAARYALRAIRPGSSFLAYLTIPLTFNYLFHQGFYNFCTSVVVFLFVLGYWLRRREDMTIIRTAILFLFAVLSYGCHLFALSMEVVTLAVIAGWFTLVDLFPRWKANTLTLKSTWESVRSRCVFTGLAFLPPMIQARRFHFATGKHLGLFEKGRWASIANFDILVSYRNVERWAALALAIMFATLIVIVALRKISRQSWTVWDGLLLLPVTYLAIYFTHAGTVADIYFIPKRLLLFFYFGILMWLAAQTFEPVLRNLVRFAGIGVAVVLAVLHWQSYAAYNPQIAEFVKALSRIEPQSTVLPLMFSPRGFPTVSDPGPTVAPFYMAAGYVTCEKQAVDLRNYEAKEFYFPVRFQKLANPYEWLAINESKPDGSFSKGFDCIPQRFNLSAYTAKTGLKVDYVMISTIPPELRNHIDTQIIIAQLNAGYNKIPESSNQNVELWRRKDWHGR